MVPALIRLRRGRPPRCSITADMPQRSTLHRSRRICRALIPRTSAAGTQLSCLVIAFVITSRGHCSHLPLHAARYRASSGSSAWPSLNVYDPDISNVYDSPIAARIALLSSFHGVSLTHRSPSMQTRYSDVSIVSCSSY
jgi:hypothetical protein